MAINRISEAVSEIRKVAKRDPKAAAEGAVLFLERISPALCQVDSSSGSLGSAVHSAVEDLAPLIINAQVEDILRKKWLERLFDATQEDDPLYIESLGDRWGDLCTTSDIASEWADRLKPSLLSTIRARHDGTFAFFAGGSHCYSALFKAGRHDEILTLLENDPHPIWAYLIWGARVYAERGNIDEAISYVQTRSTRTSHSRQMAVFAEELLLKAGRRAEAFDRYALLANQSNSNLSTYRALARKYPEIEPAKLLGFLVDSSGGEPGKWFATAKTLKLFDVATKLAWSSPCDPKTLIRAARDHVISNPAFAMQSGLAALHWMSLGHGYELTSLDAQDAHQLTICAAEAVGQQKEAEALIDLTLSESRPASAWMKRSLGLGPTASAAQNHRPR